MNRANSDQVLEWRQDYLRLGSWERVGEQHSLPGRYVQKAWYNARHRKNLPDPVTEPQQICISVEESEHSTNVDNVIQFPDTDHDAWDRALAALPDVYRVAWFSDFHIPDHDPRALDLAVRIVSDFNPHVLANGGDAFDFSTIGRWDVDPDDITTDVFQQISRPYGQIMRSFHDAAPEAKTVFIVGNHDERVYKFLSRNAPQMRYTVNQLFIDMIRKSGLWLGWDATEVQLPGLLLAHGTGIVSGVYPARRLADYCGFQVSALAGHCHRFDSWTRRGAKQHVYYQTSGCLCNLQPHYSTRRQNWQHGITLVTVTNGVPFMEAVPFVDYKAVWGGREYKA